jgi:hypothetical protein
MAIYKYIYILLSNNKDNNNNNITLYTHTIISVYHYVSTYAVRTATAVQGFVSHTDGVPMPVSKSCCWVMLPTRYAFSCYEIILYFIRCVVEIYRQAIRGYASTHDHSTPLLQCICSVNCTSLLIFYK